MPPRVRPQGVTYRYKIADADSVMSVRQVQAAPTSPGEKRNPGGTNKREPRTTPIAGVPHEYSRRRCCNFDTRTWVSRADSALSPGQTAWFGLDNGCPVPLAHGALLRIARLSLVGSARTPPNRSGGKDVSRYVVRQRRRKLPGLCRPILTVFSESKVHYRRWGESDPPAAGVGYIAKSGVAYPYSSVSSNCQ